MSIQELQLATETAVFKRRLSIVYREPGSLIPDPKNPRRHPARKINLLMRNIGKLGFNVPVLIDPGSNIISGHARVQAALALRLDAIPTICIDDLTPSQIKALKIADNRLGELSDWDHDLLAKIFQELRLADLDLDLEITGFSLDEIDLHIESLNATAPNQDDQVPPLTEGPTVSVEGDLWLLADHRLLHGDSTKSEDFSKLMQGKPAAMTFTDPPYNVDYGHSAKDKLRGTDQKILNDNLGDKFGSFLSSVCSNIISVTQGGIYICMSSSELHTLQGAFETAGGHWSTFVIWAKQCFTLGRSDYQRQYEPILYGWRKGAERFWCGARDQGDVWFFNKPARNDLHPTMKPVALVMRAIRNSSERGEIVLDPFMGSGTTIIAAEKTGRICYGLELDPPYVDTIIRRWQKLTGKLAVHADSGKTFDAVSQERGLNHVGTNE